MVICTAQNTWSSTGRMKRRSDFVRCYDLGRRYFSNFFVLFVYSKLDLKNVVDLDRHEQYSWRVGFAVTKKMGNAVRRNKLKRLFREFFRQHKHLLVDGYDMVLVPKKNLVGMPVDYAFVEQELTPLMSKVYKKLNSKT